MSGAFLQFYRRLTKLTAWLVGFYAAPLLHVIFTSVFGAAGFAYGFARGHLSQIHDEILQALLAGLAFIVAIEVYLHDGLHRLGIRTFVRRVRFVNSMFEDGRLKINRTVAEYEKLLWYLTEYGQYRALFGPFHVAVVLGTVLVAEYTRVHTGHTDIYIQTALVTLPIHVLFVYVTGDLHMGRYRSLVKRQLFFMGHEPPNAFSISLKWKFASIMSVIAISDYILVSLLRSDVAKTGSGYHYIIGFSIFSLALLLALTVLFFSNIFASIKELQIAAVGLQEGHDPDFYSRASDRELATLSSGFFHAAQRVLNYRRDLEQQIREATAHLSQANAELQQKDHEIQTELDFASEIQREMIPQQHAPWNAVQFGILYRPMHKVSGDFLNVYKKDGSIFVLLADVSGHGVPAALITMAANDAFAAAIRHSDSPAAVFREVNAQLSDQIKTQDYLTAFLVRIDAKLRITYANASHPNALHYHSKTHTLESYDTAGLFIGAMSDATESYEEKTARLEFGDLLVLYSDGITEQTNPGGEEFGPHRLQHLLLTHHTQSPQSIADAVSEELIRFAASQQLRDDVSMIVLRVHPHYLQFIEKFNETVRAMKRRTLHEASGLLEELWKLYPEFPALPFLSARIHYRLRDFELAEKHIKMHLERYPEDVRATQLLAAIALKTGNRSRAANLVGRLAKAHADDRVTRHLQNKLQ